MSAQLAAPPGAPSADALAGGPTAQVTDSSVNTTALVVLVALFAVVTVLGFLASRWRRAESLDSLDEWGLGGRKFGTWVTWFLLGGDLYTAYTFVAVPAAMFSLGAVAGFFAVPYTIILYPIIFLFMARLWSVSHRHGYVTTADFVRGRYDDRHLSLAVSVTGFVATMPYIALQLVGIQAVLEVAGVGGGDNIIAQDAPLLIAFAVLAAYTYSSGLRAPAIIAFVKDALIYVVIIVAVIYLPSQVGGWDDIFGAAQDKMATPNPDTGAPTGSFIPGDGQMWAYATLGLGSAMALFMYPHSVTASLSSGSRNTIRRNAAILPAYSFVLGLLALLGWVAIAAGTDVTGLDGEKNPQLVVPQLFEDFFPDWFVGVAFAAIAIGALVPAAIMSIAAANTFSRNIYKEWLKKDATPQQEAKVSKLMSLVVKAFALVFVLTLDKQNAINFQLLGGIWILQTFPAIVFSLYTRWFHRKALLAGWAVGMVYGTVEAYQVSSAATDHFGGSLAEIPGLGDMGYIAITAFALNLVVTVLLTVLLHALKVPNGRDATTAGDYYADAGDPRVDSDLAAADPLAVEPDLPGGRDGGDAGPAR
ncbi:monocarboxylate uptake permease MctP [Nocardioides dongxiaopingii]|uniref:monocarboxylate uptake permease MctP n=1 Tax=Nocardioides dongxiaopingii TaxID=2576036 RepID=UPI0024827C15|nr:sodium:solute symporter family protein [Nocardioides dongxiaopingii]